MVSDFFFSRSFLSLFNNAFWYQRHSPCSIPWSDGEEDAQRVFQLRFNFFLLFSFVLSSGLRRGGEFDGVLLLYTCLLKKTLEKSLLRRDVDEKTRPFFFPCSV